MMKEDLEVTLWCEISDELLAVRGAVFNKYKRSDAYARLSLWYNWKLQWPL